MAKFLYAHVFTAPAPDIPLSELRGIAVKSRVNGEPTWSVNPAWLLGEHDPQYFLSKFRSWRQQWQTTIKLDPPDCVTHLAHVVSPAFPVWSDIRENSRIDPEQAGELVRSLPGVRKVSAARSASSVVLYSPERAGTVFAWPDGTNSVLTASESVELAVTGQGLEISCPVCGADRVTGWNLTGRDDLEVELTCSLGPRTKDIPEDIKDYLWALGSREMRVQVLVRPWAVSVARTLNRLEDAAQVSIESGNDVLFSTHSN